MAELPIAGLSAPRWKELDRRDRGTRFIAIEPRRIVNSSAMTGMRFWSINPYIGCEFGCAYCYARDTHRWTVERATADAAAPIEAREAATLAADEAFERRILVKAGAADVLARTLVPAMLHGESVMIGTATDPYQPAERRFRVTRSLLETLRGFHGLRIGIITKSPLITRDVDLLAGLARRNDVSVNISLASVDAPLLRRLEPRTPTPAARLRALRRLVSAGVRCGVLVAPILPGITDGRDALRAVMQAARDAGAETVSGVPLRMGPATRRTFLPWIDRERPRLAARYRKHFAGRQHTSPLYQAALRDRLRKLQTELGVPSRHDSRASSVAEPDDLQIPLWSTDRLTPR